MSPVIEIFGKTIPLYGLSWIVGIALSAVVAVCLCRRAAIERYDLVYSAVFAVIGGLIGSKLLFIIVSLRQIIEQQIPFLAVMRGGFVFYGGLLGGMVGLYLYVHVYKLPKPAFADVYAVAVPLGHACGRVGCYIGGCCYGMPYDGPLSVTYTTTMGSTPLNTPLFPIQLAEAVGLLVLFVALLLVYRKQRTPGTATAVYLLGYAALRFTLEFFRGDGERGALLALSTSQWISVGIVLAVVAVLIIRRKKAANT